MGTVSYISDEETYLPFQEADVQEFLSKLCASALLYLQRIYHNQPQKVCPLHGKDNVLKGTEGNTWQSTDFLQRLQQYFSIKHVFIWVCVNRHTCENSWWLTAVFFCHIVTDVTSCVTWCKQAFDIEWSKLGKNDTGEQTSGILGLYSDCKTDSLMDLLWRCWNEKLSL